MRLRYYGLIMKKMKILYRFNYINIREVINV